mmetsp:Transcript_3587/g.6263  ORF Transcript_3587/g.6263 Transcript_3587/m.6263 type:complete len:99 (+) Transcript_3587:111-407(+)
MSAVMGREKGEDGWQRSAAENVPSRKNGARSRGDPSLIEGGIKGSFSWIEGDLGNIWQTNGGDLGERCRHNQRATECRWEERMRRRRGVMENNNELGR